MQFSNKLMKKQEFDLSKVIVYFAIVLAFMFLFRFIPPIGTITPYGMAVIGIFIGMIYIYSADFQQAFHCIFTAIGGGNHQCR